MKGRYKYVRATARNKALLDGCPSAGPRANVTGMRRLYWGEDAFVVRCGAYIYMVPYELFYDLE